MHIRGKMRLGLMTAALVVLTFLGLDQAVSHRRQEVSSRIEHLNSSLSALDDARLCATRVLGTLPLPLADDAHETAERMESLQKLRHLLRSPILFTPSPDTRARLVGFMHLAAACDRPPGSDPAALAEAHLSGERLLQALFRERSQVFRALNEARGVRNKTESDTALLHLLSSLSFIAIVFLLGQNLARSVLHPLELLRDRMLRAEAGICEEPMAESRKDEIGPIFGAFNRLSESLRVRKRELERRTRRIEGLAAITTTASWPADAKRFLQEVLAQTVLLLERDVGILRLIEPGSQRLKLSAVFGVHEGLDVLECEIEKGQYATGLTVQTGEPMVVDDVSSDPRMGPFEFVRRERLVSIASVPIISRGRSIGCILVAARRRCRYSAEDVALLQTVGRVLGAAVENARLVQETSERSRELSTLLDLARAVSGSADLGPLGERALEILARPLQADCGFLAVSDPSTGELVTRSAFGRHSDALREIAWPLDDGSVIADVYNSCRPLLVPEALSDARGPRMLAERFGFRSYLAAPIFHERQRQGVIVVGSTRAAQPTEAHLMPLVATAASQLALVVENAHLWDAQRRRTAGAGLPPLIGGLRETTEAEIHEAVAESAPRLFPGRSGFLTTAGGGRLAVVTRWGTPDGVRAPYIQHCPIAQGQRPCVTPPPEGCEAAAIAGTAHLRCVPVSEDGQVLGALHLISPAVPFSAADKRLQDQLAEQVALALLALRRSATARSSRPHSDLLTGFPNLAAFQELATFAIESARDKDGSAAVLSLKVGGLSKLAENYGTGASERLLRTVAKRIKAALRESDLVGRSADDEFVALLQGAGAAIAAQVAGRLKEELKRLDVDGIIERMAPAVGIALYPGDGRSPGELIEAARRTCEAAFSDDGEARGDDAQQRAA